MKRRDSTHRTGVDIATEGRFGAPPLAIGRPPTVQLRAGYRQDSRNFINFLLLIDLVVQVDFSFKSKSSLFDDVINLIHLNFELSAFVLTLLIRALSSEGCPVVKYFFTFSHPLA